MKIIRVILGILLISGIFGTLLYIARAKEMVWYYWWLSGLLVAIILAACIMLNMYIAHLLQKPTK